MSSEDRSAGPADSVDPAGPAQVAVRLALSPSRAIDFKTCPLLYRLRAIDRVAEPPSKAAVRGTLVHAVLEQLFGRTPADRTEAVCVDSIGPTWAALSANPELAALVDKAELPGWLAEAAALVKAYFTLENPAGFTPEACELAITVDLPNGEGDLPLKGFIDRVDLADTGELRIVDYKTGRSPSEFYEMASLYQLKFYALMIFRQRGIVATELKLIYLADATTLRYRPNLAELLAFERGLAALWTAVTSAVATGDFPPNRSGACRRCSHQALCPEFGGTPPPYLGPVGRTDQPGAVSAARPVVSQPAGSDV